MRILLFGEYSGLFNSLKEGLVELGHDVFHASNGDGYKNYPSDFRWDMHIPGKPGVVAGILNVFTHLNKFKDFDVVHVISPFPLFQKFFNERIFEFLVKYNKKVFISGAGLHPFSFDFWNTHTETKYYNYTQGEIEAARKQNKKFSLNNNPGLRAMEDRIFNLIDGYLPIMYEYSFPYKEHPKNLKTIPIPINLKKFTYSPNIINNGKILFFHGLTRECKGGKFIISAFDQLAKKYPNDAEFLYKGGMPFDDYIQLLRRTNVVLDDVNAYSLGMNGLYSMTQGKIVMGGAEFAANKELNYEFCPAINLTRDVNQVISAIEYILENRNSIEEMGFNSRLFVEKHHDHLRVAQMYLDIWNNPQKLSLATS